jgi:hypothetical protein
MSAIVLLVLFAGFGNLTLQGRCCRNFVLAHLCSFFVEKILLFLANAGMLATHRVATASTSHNPANLTPLPPRYNLHFLYHGCRSCNPIRRLPFERDVVANMQIFAYL